MEFQPKLLQPVPDPAYVRQIRQIDPDLRVVWGYERYLLSLWAIERRIPPERYYPMYRSFIETGQPRFIEQPIFDRNQPVYNEDGEEVDHRVIGTRTFDLAPEWEWVQFIQEQDGAYRPLDSRAIVELKRIYAWNRYHPHSRARFEQQQEQERMEAARKAKRVDAAHQEFLDHRRELYNLPFSGQPVSVREGTEL